MKRGLPLALLAGSAAAMIGLPLVPHPAAGWLFVIASLLVPAALIGLGTAPARRPRALAATLIGSCAVLEAGALALLGLSASSPRSMIWHGLPLSSWVMFAVLGLAPLVLTCVGFAWLFDVRSLDADQLERLRRARRAARR
ncbi:MAG: hypothetical protein JSV80_16660 [Acidobacteriota bacterium]|nr:MAG: hypothetical protein JSV80_16660 [Acidobacteriota bacterium]